MVIVICMVLIGRGNYIGDRTKYPEPDKHMILPEVISKEPLGPVRYGDQLWTDITRWSVYVFLWKN